jgi:membrane-associated phospholipid phosphatase
MILGLSDLVAGWLFGIVCGSIATYKTLVQLGFCKPIRLQKGEVK